MGRFAGMGDLRTGAGDMAGGSAPNTIYAPEMGRSVPPIAHMPPHGAPTPTMSSAGSGTAPPPPGPSHYTAHQMTTLGSGGSGGGPLEERMSDSDLTIKAEKDAIYK